ncbi:MAG: hypothetical protein JNM56_07065 [Planctomycetia bacterium]|nr:hypothetical protein [Planctomycetia bacterium]
MARVPLCLFVIVLLACVPLRADEKADKAQLEKDLQPKLVTIKDKEINVVKALKAIHEQTGIEVLPPDDADLVLKDLNLDKTPFWQAIDRIALRGDLRVSLYGRDGKIALVKDEKGYREMPISYSGLFRTTLKRVVVVRDLETDAHYCLAKLEIAWEPRFQAFLIDTRPESLEVTDDKGLTVEVPTIAKGPQQADGRIAVELDLPLPALRRSSPKFGSIKGQLSITGSPKLLTFTFDKLAGKQEQMQEGVVCMLRNFREAKEIWTLDMALRYPPGGAKFESFQSWLINNQIYLLNKNGKRLDHAGYETDEQGANTAQIRYRFADDDEKGVKLGKSADWRLIYRTPAQIAEVPIKFEFKDVLLP